jgi:ADP-ribose pyrophosphatase YjhB (NUDIX family)
MKYKWKEIAQELQFIAQAGLTYSKDVYDLERFQRLREISTEIMSNFTDTDMDKITTLFASESGYQTPKIDIRGVIFQKEKLLFVREKKNQCWSLPGGWADIGLTPAENVVKEVMEEAGLAVRAEKVIALWDKKKHDHPPSPYYTYKIVILCQVVGGSLTPGIETDDVCFFDRNSIPELSLSRNTPKQIEYIFDYFKPPPQETDFD